jgi:hypothetical protein
MKENILEKSLIVLFMLLLAPTPAYLVGFMGTMPLLLTLFLVPGIIKVVALINIILWFLIYYFVINFLYKINLRILGNIIIIRVLMVILALIVLYFSFSNIYVNGDVGGGRHENNIISLIRQSTTYNVKLYLCELQNNNLNKIGCLFEINNTDYDYCKNIKDVVYCFSEMSIMKKNKDICLDLKNELDQKSCIDYYNFKNRLE